MFLLLTHVWPISQTNKQFQSFGASECLTFLFDEWLKNSINHHYFKEFQYYFTEAFLMSLPCLCCMSAFSFLCPHVAVKRSLTHDQLCLFNYRGHTCWVSSVWCHGVPQGARAGSCGSASQWRSSPLLQSGHMPSPWASWVLLNRSTHKHTHVHTRTTRNLKY